MKANLRSVFGLFCSFVIAVNAHAAVPTVISKVPYEITKPGRYALSKSLTYTGEGDAIKISSDNVVLDLQDWALESKAASPAATLAEGVHSDGHSNVIIRNGTLRGFFRGMYLAGATGINCLVENVRVEGCTFAGIQVYGNDAVVRGCRVANIGGTTAFPSHRVGIEVGGNAARVLNNDISEIVGGGVAIHRYGILCVNNNVTSALIMDNRVLMASNDITGYGIYMDNAGWSIVERNEISAFGYGVFFSSGTSSTYRDNTVTRAAVAQYTAGGATDGAGNK